MNKTFWTDEEQAVFRELSTPFKIQEFLEGCAYPSDPPAGEELFTRSPRRVMRERTAHCFDGALLSAAALEQLGYPPLIMDMRAENDDDHIIAPYRVGTHWGALSKSNFAVLLNREPVYRSLRELVMSYFDFYYNDPHGKKTLRRYSRPLDLRRLESEEWRTTEKNLDYFTDILEQQPYYNLLTSEQEQNLQPVLPRVHEAGKLGTNEKGIYTPK